MWKHNKKKHSIMPLLLSSPFMTESPHCFQIQREKHNSRQSPSPVLTPIGKAGAYFHIWKRVTAQPLAPSGDHF